MSLTTNVVEGGEHLNHLFTHLDLCGLLVIVLLYLTELVCVLFYLLYVVWSDGIQNVPHETAVSFGLLFVPVLRYVSHHLYILRTELVGRSSRKFVILRHFLSFELFVWKRLFGPNHQVVEILH